MLNFEKKENCDESIFSYVRFSPSNEYENKPIKIVMVYLFGHKIGKWLFNHL